MRSRRPATVTCGSALKPDWFVSMDGIFAWYKDTSGAFANTSVLGLTPDSDGSLWLRLRDLTVLRYRNGVFENPLARPEPYSNISAMSRANHGGLLVAKMEEGAFEYRSGAFQSAGRRSTGLASFSRHVPGPNRGRRDLAGHTRRRALPSGRRQSDLDHKRSARFQGQLSACQTANGICGSAPTTASCGGTGPSLRQPESRASLNNFQALAMTRDRDANIWVGTDSRGLLRFNAQGVASLRRQRSVRRGGDGSVRRSGRKSVDRKRSNGIERLRDSAFVTYSLAEGLPSDGSNPVFVDAENRMWFAPFNRRTVVVKGWTTRTCEQRRIGQGRGLLHRRRQRRTVARPAAWRTDQITTRREESFIARHLDASRWARSKQRLLGLSNPRWNSMGRNS